jgi:DeoR/GlpR family transcriptional regulator of sugar metabolism
MLKKERHDFILRQINLHNKVLCTDLCTLLKVSEDTVRRDLNELAIEHKIVKVHGGALSKSFHENSNQNDVYAYEKKVIIAQKAVKLIKNDMLVLTSSGTTLREMVRLLPKNLKATFFTISLTIADELLKHPNIEVVFLGGKLSKAARISVGGEVFLRLAEMSFDLCIIGTNGIDSKNGLTESDLEVVQVKKAMLKASKAMMVLCVSEKLNAVRRATICAPHQINYLITELNPEDELLAAYRQTGIQVI